MPARRLRRAQTRRFDRRPPAVAPLVRFEGVPGEFNQHDTDGSGACKAVIIAEIMKPHAERPVEQENRIASID